MGGVHSANNLLASLAHTHKNNRIHPSMNKRCYQSPTETRDLIQYLPRNQLLSVVVSFEPNKVPTQCLTSSICRMRGSCVILLQHILPCRALFYNACFVFTVCSSAGKGAVLISRLIKRVVFTYKVNSILMHTLRSYRDLVFVPQNTCLFFFYAAAEYL